MYKLCKSKKKNHIFVLVNQHRNYVKYSTYQKVLINIKVIYLDHPISRNLRIRQLHNCQFHVNMLSSRFTHFLILDLLSKFALYKF